VGRMGFGGSVGKAVGEPLCGLPRLDRGRPQRAAPTGALDPTTGGRAEGRPYGMESRATAWYRSYGVEIQGGRREAVLRLPTPDPQDKDGAMKKKPEVMADLNAEACRIWDANAEWWDDKIGDGNALQIELIEPATERLLGIASGETVLDIGCGAGRFARRMAELGACVVAIDFSERFIARAKERTPPEMSIEYLVMDATNREKLLTLGANRFDAAVATMALMDMATIEPLMGALRELLKPGGRFVFSVIHPCFDSSHTCKFAEQVVADGRVTTRRGVMVRGYLTPTACRAEGIVGQPEPQHYFHRPLGMLLNAGFREGFAIDGLEEPAFRTGVEDAAAVWWRHPDIPPVLVVRMRLLK